MHNLNSMPSDLKIKIKLPDVCCQFYFQLIIPRFSFQCYLELFSCPKFMPFFKLEFLSHSLLSHLTLYQFYSMQHILPCILSLLCMTFFLFWGGPETYFISILSVKFYNIFLPNNLFYLK